MSCNDGIACTTDLVLGSEANCNLACGRQTITTCRNGDGCCPAGCAGADDDCSTTCGNGTIDSGETCDGEDCPLGCESGACVVSTYVGSPSTCNAECVTTEITTCSGGDGCCPAQCTMATDSDCTGAPTGAVGDPCTDATECSGITSPFTPVCITGFPGGYCSVFCTDGMCPTGSRCALNLEYLCVKECTTANDCRTPDYACQELFDPTEQTFMGCAAGGQ